LLLAEVEAGAQLRDEGGGLFGVHANML
jgi:hypothetical protein